MPASKKASKKTSKPASKKKPAPRRAAIRTGRAGKAEGDAPVKAFIAKLPGWKKDVAKRFDDIIAREVPGVKRAIKWSSPMYGVEGQGWFASLGVFSRHVKLVFFRGTSLKPPPPSGESEQMRGLDIRESDPFDEKRVTDWVRQASKIPGWGS